ncbi:MAG: hypothetical protein A2075_20755 [Geobacteraceae bacterium GWC2_58_44]|nr:MAG: hypothetical protein A2075_20755 [Geobacteraceae bacterium GWC2_58_44]HBG05290.1 hypothetical protein [Geobacter sp.]
MKKVIVTVAAVASFIVMVPLTGFAGPVDVNIRIDGYLPAPPGVRILLDAGRPYYVEDNRRVYVEKKPKHDNGRHRGHDKQDQGRKKGHGKKDRHD